MNAETRQCQNCRQEFRIEPDDFAFYGKTGVPAPTFCPRCRLQRRLAFRNERSLYKRKCDLCNADIIAMYPAGSRLKVYCPACFHSDKWDPMDYGRDYDFSRPFFEQWRELMEVMPHLSLLQENVVNSPWVNYETDEKNCYLNVGGHFNEDSAYNQYALESCEVYDNFWAMKSELAYENILCRHCWRIFFSQLCIECRDTWFSLDCRNCDNIFGCVGLRSKKYYVFNEYVGKDGFEKFMQENDLSSERALRHTKRRVADVYRTVPQRMAFIDSKSVDSVGNFIVASKNCRFCWIAEKCEYVNYGLLTLDTRDCMDVTSVWWGERSYEAMGVGRAFNMKFSAGIDCHDLDYSALLFNSAACFGCVNLKKKNFCILNKQYGEGEYRALVPRIRAHMADMPYTDAKGRVYRYGEFFPPELSLFGYNETIANEYFPLSREEAEEKGFPWADHEPSAGYTFSDYQIPDRIADVGDDILDKVLKCEVSGKAYRIIPMELTFYRRMGLPIPRVSPFERHRRRLRFIADHMALRSRTCAKCGRQIESVYTQEEYPIVYCESCYQAEVA